MGERLSEALAVMAAVDPTGATGTTGTATSDVIDMDDFGSVLFVVLVGAIAATGTVDFKVEEGTSTSSFNTSTALVSATQLGASDDNKQVIVEVPAEALSTGYRYLRGILTQGTAASFAAVVALGGKCRHKPAKDLDLASVDEIAVA